MFSINIEQLTKAWREIYRTKPRAKRAYSRGIDNVSVEDFEKGSKGFLDEIDRQIKGGFFKFNRLKEYFITPPGKKKSRLIQAPTVTDRIVQKVIADDLMRHFLAAFNDAGVVGSVKGNTTAKLLKRAVEYNQQGFCFVLKTDIKDFFPSIDKKRLKKKFYEAISDVKLRLFFDQYITQSRKPGVPQGTPLSPMMANIYLLDFDKVLSKDTDIKHFRYVDDLVVFCKDEKTAVRIYRKVKKLFSDIGLEIHDLGTEGKTYIDRFDAGRVDVLGIIYKKDRLLIKPKKYKKFIQERINPVRFISCLDLKGEKPYRALNGLLIDLKHQVSGWAAAYAFCDVKNEFLSLDEMLRKNFEELLGKLGIAEADRMQYIKKLPLFSNAIRGKKERLPQVD